MRHITAMLLAAGLGTRLRPLTYTLPKPLVKIAGRTIIDRLLDTLAEAGVRRAIVNVHHHADQIENHMQQRHDIEIMLSDERQQLLDTGGAVIAAREIFADNPAFIINTDAFWHGDNSMNPFTLLAQHFDPEHMDYLMLVADKQRISGYRGQGDFFRDNTGRLTRRGNARHAPFVHAGVYILHPQILANRKVKPFSANLLWDQAIDRKRLFSLVLDAFWMHVGDMQAVQEAENYLAQTRTT